jgi:hypothetical protein
MLRLFSPSIKSLLMAPGFYAPSTIFLVVASDLIVVEIQFHSCECARLCEQILQKKLWRHRHADKKERDNSPATNFFVGSILKTLVTRIALVA